MLRAFDCACDAACTSHPVPTQKELYDECRAQPWTFSCAAEPMGLVGALNACGESSACSAAIADTARCPPVDGRPRYPHVDARRCPEPPSDPGTRKVTAYARRCSVDVTGAGSDALRPWLERTPWLECLARPLEGSEALMGAHVKLAVMVDRTGDLIRIDVEGVADTAAVACMRRAVATDLQSGAARLAGTIRAGSSEWVLGRR
jgi:hypothetical protein